MARTLTPEPAFSGTTAEPDSGGPPESGANEYELVLSLRQMGAALFVMLVIFAVSTAGAYLVGKSLPGVHAAGKAPPRAEPAPAPQAAPTEAASVAPAQPAAPPVATIEKPLFSQPLKGVIYIQMGAVEKGIAEILAEGFRKRGFESFVAPGPSEKIFRVLIGPFRSSDEYQASKAAIDRMGLDSFARKYEE